MPQKEVASQSPFTTLQALFDTHTDTQTDPRRFRKKVAYPPDRAKSGEQAGTTRPLSSRDETIGIVPIRVGKV